MTPTGWPRRSARPPRAPPSTWCATVSRLPPRPCRRRPPLGRSGQRCCRRRPASSTASGVRRCLAPRRALSSPRSTSCSSAGAPSPPSPKPTRRPIGACSAAPAESWPVRNEAPSPRPAVRAGRLGSHAVAGVQGDQPRSTRQDRPGAGQDSRARVVIDRRPPRPYPGLEDRHR